MNNNIVLMYIFQSKVDFNRLHYCGIDPTELFLGDQD